MVGIGTGGDAGAISHKKINYFQKLLDFWKFLSYIGSEVMGTNFYVKSIRVIVH